MRRTRPSLGWEKAKNCFPVPNELLDFDLPAGAVAVYIYLLRHANRKTNQCHPSEVTIGGAVNMSRNTVRKYVMELEERELIRTEPTSIITADGRKRNGSLCYTILPIQLSSEQYYQRQFHSAELALERQRAARRMERLAQKVGAEC